MNDGGLSRPKPRRRRLLERLGLSPDLADQIAARLRRPATGPAVDVWDAVLRQELAWIEETSQAAVPRAAAWGLTGTSRGRAPAPGRPAR